MKLPTITKSPPHGFLRLVFRFPVWLYKLNLGWILGDRLLMFTHIGRKSGKKLHTVVEVVRHNQEKSIYTISAGWGEKSDWFQNVIIHPEVEVKVGSRKFSATAVRLTQGEAREALREYAVRHPALFKGLMSLIIGDHSNDVESMVYEMADKIPQVDLRKINP